MTAPLRAPARAPHAPDPEPGQVVYRTIQADDVERLRRMFGRCSRETIYRRFFSYYQEAPEWVLRRLTFVDYVHRHAVVAVVDDEIVGVARFDKIGSGDEAEIAVCVEDGWQRRGIARRLIEWMVDIARTRGVTTMTADVQADNAPALALLREVLPGAEVTAEGTTFSVRAPL